jgi:hypothetical protein
VVRHGLRMTSPTATAVHLARHLDRPFGLSALDAMCHAGLVTPAELVAAVKRYPHHPGIVKARELVRLVEPATESPGESWLRLRLIDANLGTPVPQVEVVDGPRRFRIDIGMREPLPDGRRLGLEYDSDRWHSAHEELGADAARADRLERLGWVMLSVRRGDVWGRDPALELTVGGMLGITPVLPRLW